MNKGIFVNDSLHGLIPITYFEKKIISHSGFNRLHDVYQNSTVYLTFPSNRTKRFEHSVGTMKLCSDMFFYTIHNTENLEILEDFLKNGQTEINEIIKNSKHKTLKDKTLKDINVPEEKFFDSLVPSNINLLEFENKKIVYSILMQAIRVAALLHDIGHPPYSHVVENALTNVLDQVKDTKDNSKIDTFIEKINSSKINPNQKLHEQMGNKISEKIINDITSKEESNEFYVLVGLLVQEMYKEKIDYFKCLHKIIDSSVDGDRLDYVTRDSVNSGLTTGSIDYSRIIQGMTLQKDGDNSYVFAFSMKSITSIEDFLRRRFNIYQDIIYHHRVVKMNYLLQNIVEKLSLEYLYSPNEETENNRKFIDDISGLWTVLDLKNSEILLPQWNDSWLMTILKKIYMSEYYEEKKEMNSQKKIIRKQLQEFLYNEKKYKSCIKRREDFLIIERKIRKSFKLHEEELNQLLKFNYYEEAFEKLSSKDQRITRELNILESTFLVKFWNDSYGIYDILENFLYKLDPDDKFALEITETITSIVNKSANKIFEGKNEDNFISYTHISFKEKTLPIFNKDKGIEKIKDVSKSSEILATTLSSNPYFYYYYGGDITEQEFKKNKNIFLEEVGEEIGEYLFSIIKRKKEG